MPARAVKSEAMLLGKPWNADTVHAGKASLQSEFSPISDMRASQDYRQMMLGQLLWRFWLETQGQSKITLADITVVEELL